MFRSHTRSQEKQLSEKPLKMLPSENSQIQTPKYTLCIEFNEHFATFDDYDFFIYLVNRDQEPFSSISQKTRRPVAALQPLPE